MRLFAAVLPPPEALAELAGVVRELRALPGADQLRFTGREQWHYTVAFYGEVTPEVLPDLRTRLERAASRHSAGRLRIAGGGSFGHTLLWAGAEGDTAGLRGLAGSARAAGRRAGAPGAEGRAYVPHLTLARGRAGESGLAPYLEALNGFRGREWPLEELVLVRSRLPEGGVPGERPHYAAVASWPLAR